MLVAYLDGVRLPATDASRGQDYLCPDCKQSVVLRKGEVVAHHFAHKPDSKCAYRTNETRAHLTGKQVLLDAFRKRGLDADVEVPFRFLDGDRRADICVRRPNGQRVAFELQHTPLDLAAMKLRSSAYSQGGVAQMWIPFLRRSLLEKLDELPNEMIGRHQISKYQPHPYELWLHDRPNGLGLWMYHASGQHFWSIRFEKHMLWQEYSEWHDEYGEEHYSGGHKYASMRFRDVVLHGPHEPQSLRIQVKKLSSASEKRRIWPGGLFATFVIATKC